MVWVQKVDTPHGEVLIRMGETADARGCVLLFRDVVAEERYLATSLVEFSRDTDEQARIIHYHSVQSNGCYFVALYNQHVIGQVSILGGALLRTRHVGQLEIYLASEFRGLGLGRILMETALQWAKRNRSLRKVSLSVFPDNQGAVVLYQKLGFIQEACLKDEFVEVDNRTRDKLIMSIWL